MKKTYDLTGCLLGCIALLAGCATQSGTETA